MLVTPVAGDAVFAGTVVVGVVIWDIGWWVRRSHDGPGVEGLWAFSALVGAAAVVAGTYGLAVVDLPESSAAHSLEVDPERGSTRASGD